MFTIKKPKTKEQQTQKYEMPEDQRQPALSGDLFSFFAQ